MIRAGFEITPRLDGPETRCACGARFRVPRSLRGGYANCPRCGQAARVPGGPEPLFTVLVGCGVAAVLALTGVLWGVWGPVAGLVALVAGGLVLGAIVAAS